MGERKRERERAKRNRTKIERQRETVRERESKAVELCSVVTGAESKNSNLVITAHYCLHGKQGGGGGRSTERDGDDFHSRRNPSLLKQHLNHLTPAASTANYLKTCL